MWCLAAQPVNNSRSANISGLNNNPPRNKSGTLACSSKKHLIILDYQSNILCIYYIIL